MLSFHEASALARRLGTRLLAVDGLPCSGKSTLAAEIVEVNGFKCIAVDDFFRRYGEFLTVVGELAGSGRCSYYPFDWPSMKVSQELRTVTLADGPVIVEAPRLFTQTLHRFSTSDSLLRATKQQSLKRF